MKAISHQADKTSKLNRCILIPSKSMTNRSIIIYFLVKNEW